MQDAPAFDFYPERWTHGTRHMTKVERCDYIDLLCHQWTDDGLPADLQILARLIGYRKSVQIPPFVLEKFPLAADGKRRNPRLEVERENQRARIEKAREKGQKMAAGRWSKQSTSNACASPVHCLEDAHHSPLTTHHSPNVLFQKEPKGGPQEIPETQEKPEKGNSRLPTTETAKRLAVLFRRRLSTEWTQVEITAFKRQQPMAEDDLAAIEAYYNSHWPPNRENNILRNDLKTLFNNWPGEVDRANAWKAAASRPPTVTVIPSMPLKSFAQQDLEAKKEARFGSEPIKMRRAAVWDPDAPEPKPEPTTP